MNSVRSDDLLSLIAKVARQVPSSVVEQLCGDLMELRSAPTPHDRHMLAAKIALPVPRNLVSDLLSVWATRTPSVQPDAVALALKSASKADEYRRSWQSVELVWTGPTCVESSLRRTDQVLLDLIRSAGKSITIVTFAAYRIPEVRAALIAAADRGVQITLIVESAEVSDGKVAYEALEALGANVARMSSVYIWPLDKRPRDAGGNHGSLHIKCAIADGSSVLVSSANLTGYALNLNMELGVLIRGGNLPGHVEKHLHELIVRQVLMPMG